MTLDPGDGRLSGDGVYRKTAAGPDPHSGTVYAVVGTSGLVAEMPPLEHPAMAVSLAAPGSLILDVVGDRLEGRFLDDEGVVQDEFTIVKNTAQAPLADFTARPLDGPSPLEVRFEDLSSTNVTGWSWDFEADGMADSNEREPTGLYIEPGTYAVELTVSNDAGTATETKTEYITVGCAVVDETRGLVFGPAPSELSWSDFAGTTYDVVKGDLLALRAGAGDFTGSLEVCLLDDGADPVLSDPSVPVPGGGLYYLVRAKGCDGVVASYNASEGGLAASRDRPISISAQACP